MKKLLISLAVVGVLVGLMAAPVMAEDVGEVGKTASVTVNAYKSVTVTDNGSPGLDFGSLTPGTEDEPEAASPSLTIAAAVENNGNVAVSIKGTDFSDGGSNSFDIENATWNTSDETGSDQDMLETYAPVGTLPASTSLSIYHWLSIPGGQAAASYTSTFTYKTE
ncbi:MAG TPA: hypothetical protein G4N90_01600 [Dehalococcoidia bacterium]|nr:hypothetical protein [Dehalococcoidia bacterium]